MCGVGSKQTKIFYFVPKKGSVFWPGSEVDVQNIHRPLVSKYDSKTPYETRVQTVLNYVDAGARFVSFDCYLTTPQNSFHVVLGYIVFRRN